MQVVNKTGGKLLNSTGNKLFKHVWLTSNVINLTAKRIEQYAGNNQIKFLFKVAKLTNSIALQDWSTFILNHFYEK